MGCFQSKELMEGRNLPQRGEVKKTICKNVISFMTSGSECCGGDGGGSSHSGGDIRGGRFHNGGDNGGGRFQMTATTVAEGFRNDGDNGGGFDLDGKEAFYAYKLGAGY
ncbi:hypothetical protein HPP92_026986 [Vanilla planifolia]|uniref:Uncharacterized protein n=1 Tax=Vanilla planifolia TaxID=51239 RepID=A0A835PCY1_VANPL|nr:hypothetical protein HPP92_026986 [Vanilla planifolia]